MKEARSCYFATHPWDWVHGNTDDLSDMFSKLAQGAGLLGASIHEIQLSWDGPEELKHANYVINCFSLEQNRFFKGIQAFVNWQKLVFL